MKFEQIRLQIHIRGLYERLGAQAAELLVVDAFVKEQARHERMTDPQAVPSYEPVATRQECVDTQ
jgi:hypothetical protein